MCFDDKRFVLNDWIHALAYFHKDLRKKFLIDDHKEKEILTDEKDLKRFTQLKVSAHKSVWYKKIGAKVSRKIILDRWVGRGTAV